MYNIVVPGIDLGSRYPRAPSRVSFQIYIFLIVSDKWAPAFAGAQEAAIAGVIFSFFMCVLGHICCQVLYFLFDNNPLLYRRRGQRESSTLLLIT